MATVEITKDNFDDIMQNNDIILLDFWASWCAPCRMFAPVFEAASEKYPNIVFGKVDTEAQPQLAGSFGIRSIPTLMIFREKVGLFQQAGALPAPALEDLIQQVLKLDMDDVRKQVAEHEAKEGQTAEA